MAANINRVVLVGNLTKDPELRHTGGGTPVCSLRIAVNTRRKDETGQWADKPNYFSISVFGNQAESCAQYLSKGRPVAIDGRLEWREWEAKDGGGKRESVEIVADSVQFLGSRDGGGGDFGGGGGGETSSCPAERPRRAPTSRARPTTTSPSRSAHVAPKEENTDTEASRRPRRGDQAPELLLLQGQGQGDRLQERQPAPPLHLGEGQDPQPPHQRCVPAPSGAGRNGREACPRDGVAAVRRRGRRGQRARGPRPRPEPRGPLMDVILTKDVEKVGLRGDVVSVARGYARNFLLPRSLAEIATPGRVAELKKRDTNRARHEAKTADRRSRSQRR